MHPYPRLTRVLGERTGKTLKKLGLETVDDLLHHYPRRYVNRGELTPLHEGEEGEYVTYVARLKDRQERRVKNNTLTLILLTFTDGATDIECAFFSKNRWRANKVARELDIGEHAIITGVVRMNRPRGAVVAVRELIHPEVHPLEDSIDPEEDPQGAKAQAEAPLVFYPAVKGVHNRTIINAVKTVLGPMQHGDVGEPVPAEVRQKYGVLTAFEALQNIHFPPTMEAVGRAKTALRFQEAFVLQTLLARRRRLLDTHQATPYPPHRGGLVDQLDDQLPFELTAGQQVVGQEISADLQRDHPMQRLLQGDVGSGKTVVALRAMLQVVDGGSQAALLAPTEVLAEQHARSIRNLLGALSDDVRLRLITGSQPRSQRQQALLDVVNGDANIIVGTHALLSESVSFFDLGLVVVDEQHRFGVDQRQSLVHKGEITPHQLVMTATPIPRSVAMTVFGDVDTSTLKDQPHGRAGVQTHVVPADNPVWMKRVWQRVQEEVESGGRAFIVCPRIKADQEDDGDALLKLLPEKPPSDLVSVEGLYKQLQSEPALEGTRIGVLHGQMSLDDKDQAMTRFLTGETPLLISTTVIEVGVDVPEATIMVIMDGHMFGLSQLHQLRGRIGRGSKPGVCLVVTNPTVASSLERLQVFESTTDGFELAEEDVKLRKEGDVLGRVQSGRRSSLKLLRVMQDQHLISQAREAAWQVIAHDPELTEHPDLAAAVERVENQQEYLTSA